MSQVDAKPLYEYAHSTLSNPMQSRVGSITTGMLVYHHVPDENLTISELQRPDVGFLTPRSNQTVCQTGNLKDNKKNGYFPEANEESHTEIYHPQLPESSLKGSGSRKNKKKNKGKGGQSKFPQTAKIGSDLFVQKSTTSVSYWDKEFNKYLSQVDWTKIPFCETFEEDEKQQARAYMINNDLDSTAMLLRFHQSNTVKMNLYRQTLRERYEQEQKVDWKEYDRTEKIRLGMTKGVSEDERKEAMKTNNKIH
mmetsp:Transcript_68443/g.147696  ORF Transcript_68443/g.147696 Transcript_68443/m.147696 type:complete len:252 (-) Transcript_68443:314-1069(-)